MSNIYMLSFPEFQRFLADALSVDADLLTPEASFLGDLAFESLKLVEMVLRMSEDLGVDVPTEAAWEIPTVGKAYEYYVKECQAAIAQQEAVRVSVPEESNVV